MGKKTKWIKGAVKHKGAMTEAAKREGVSNAEYIQEHKHDSGTSGKRARLAETLKGMNKHPSPSKMRKDMYGEK